MEQLKIDRLMAGYSREGLTERQIKNRLKKEENKEVEQRSQKEVKSFTINIEWKKSRTWGMCPVASATVKYMDGTRGETENYKASGCGYCKESTVIANIFNEVLKYKLWKLQDEGVKKLPYGIILDKSFNPYYDGGIGVSCYFTIAEFLGGEMKHTANGKTFDSYEITLN